MNLKGFEWKQSWPEKGSILTFVWRERKTTKSFGLDKQSFGWDINLGPEYEAEVSTTTSWYSVLNTSCILLNKCCQVLLQQYTHKHRNGHLNYNLKVSFSTHGKQLYFIYEKVKTYWISRNAGKIVFFFRDYIITWKGLIFFTKDSERYNYILSDWHITINYIWSNICWLTVM
jgi:hypothetical protein